MDGRPGGLGSADEYLKRTIPPIMHSPACQQDGMIVLTLDEAVTDSSSANGSYYGIANTPLPGLYGRVGALVLSPFVKPGSSSMVGYNHYSLLASEEDLFGLPHLGYAPDNRTTLIGADVCNTRPPGREGRRLVLSVPAVGGT